MPRPNDDDERYIDAVDERGVLRDGKAIRVGLMMADAARRSHPFLHDGCGGPIGGKPGYIVSDAGQATRDEPYRQMCDKLRNAWRQPTGNASPGATMTRSEAAPRHPITAADAQTIRDAAYREMCDELTNAWRRT
jgi:hypothetical protein